jgi:hypothetical protein
MPLDPKTAHRKALDKARAKFKKAQNWLEYCDTQTALALQAMSDAGDELRRLGVAPPVVGEYRLDGTKARNAIRAEYAEALAAARNGVQIASADLTRAEKDLADATEATHATARVRVQAAEARLRIHRDDLARLEKSLSEALDFIP